LPVAQQVARGPHGNRLISRARRRSGKAKQRPRSTRR
jgi:hypothetical protein